jgi:hypothetical protein
MRYIKTCILAALAAVSLFTILNASPALAEGDTALCAEHISPCEGEALIDTIHLTTTEGTIIRILESLADILCLGLLVEATVSEPGDPQLLTATEFQFHGCGYTSAHDQCHMLVEELPTFSVTRTSLNLGVLKAESGILHLHCSLVGRNCLIDLTGVELPLEGALHNEDTDNGMVTADHTELPRIKGGGWCPYALFADFLEEPLGHVYVVE